MLCEASSIDENRPDESLRPAGVLLLQVFADIVPAALVYGKQRFVALRIQIGDQLADLAEELRRFLTEAGFTDIRLTGDLTQRPPRAEEDRWNLRCRRAAE